MIENTAKRDPLIHFLGMESDGQSKYITDMESAGQRQLVASQQIPTEGSEALAALGFKLGPKVDGDPLFRTAELPAGWTKRGSDHTMWSHIHDEHGRERVAIFYKAAFYDRKAFCRAATVENYVCAITEHGAEMILDNDWATPAAMLAAAETLATEQDVRAARWDRHIAERPDDKDLVGYRADDLQRAAKFRAVAARVRQEAAK